MDDDIREALETIRDCMLSTERFDALVQEGARGDETYTLSGDDLAAVCWSLQQVYDHFGFDHHKRWNEQ